MNRDQLRDPTLGNRAWATSTRVCTGKVLPRAPRLPSLRDSEFVRAVELDIEASTCTDHSGIRQTCASGAGGGAMPRPQWVSPDETTQRCDNVVEKVSSRRSQLS